MDSKYALSSVLLLLGIATNASPCPPNSRIENIFVPALGDTAKTCAIELAHVLPAHLGYFKAGTTLELCVDDQIPTPPAQAQAYHFRLLEAAFSQDFTGIHRVLVIGTGSGVEAVTLAKHFDVQIDATDIDTRSVELTSENSKRAGVSNRVHAFESDLFAEVHGTYDLILFNAPRPLLSADYEYATRDLEGLMTWKNGVRHSLRPRYDQWLTDFDRPDLNGPYYDLRGDLLRRTLSLVGTHLGANGQFLLMSTSRMLEHVPVVGLNVQQLSQDSWHGDPADSFAIFSITK